jgi:two-component system phosphate regulon sensor histidine kinase PhoR
MAEGVMAVGRDGHILLMNQSLKDFLQIEGDPVGRNPLEVVRHIEIQEILVETLERKSGVPPAREIFLLFPQEKIVLLHAAPIMREGKLEGAVLVVHDITELRRFEKMRREFVANVSHELRTPVTSIKGYVETLLDGAIDDKDNAVEFLHIISKDAERLIRLIEDLLDLSKIESGQMSMVFKPCAVAMVVERVAAGLARVLHERQCRLRIEIPDDLPPVMADEARLAQVLVNLIDNAVKYSPSGSEVIITATVEKPYVQIDVIDNGIGIPEQDIPRIFERFYRVDKARSRDLGGTGLGLSIVKHIVQAHKGDVRVSSRVGEGSRFSFTIPKAV